MECFFNRYFSIIVIFVFPCITLHGLSIDSRVKELLQEDFIYMQQAYIESGLGNSEYIECLNVLKDRPEAILDSLNGFSQFSSAFQGLHYYLSGEIKPYNIDLLNAPFMNWPLQLNSDAKLFGEIAYNSRIEWLNKALEADLSKIKCKEHVVYWIYYTLGELNNEEFYEYYTHDLLRILNLMFENESLELMMIEHSPKRFSHNLGDYFHLKVLGLSNSMLYNKSEVFSSMLPSVLSFMDLEIKKIQKFEINNKEEVQRQFSILGVSPIAHNLISKLKKFPSLSYDPKTSLHKPQFTKLEKKILSDYGIHIEGANVIKSSKTLIQSMKNFSRMLALYKRISKNNKDEDPYLFYIVKNYNSLVMNSSK